MSTVSEVAGDAYGCFEVAEHSESEGEGNYVRVREASPDWIIDAVKAAHGGGAFLPDDWKSSPRSRGRPFQMIPCAVKHCTRPASGDVDWTFYLGTHEVSWLARDVGPLFVSHRRLASRVKFPKTVTRWALDSGGFTELAMHGRWLMTPGEYVEATRRYAAEIGLLEWAAPMDWMCEPAMLARTGLTVEDHQHRTVANYLELRERGPELPYVPVLQGWTRMDYERCIVLYQDAGVNLQHEVRVGVGSICRRQGTKEIGEIVWALAEAGLSLHGFGVKTRGLVNLSGALVSADSMAWSYCARRDNPLPGCRHQRCSSCVRYAVRWRARLLATVYPQLKLNLWAGR